MQQDSANSQSLTMIQSLSPNEWLRETEKVVPIIRRTLETYGHMSLAEYAYLMMPRGGTSYQCREDAAGVVKDVAAPILGDDIACETARELLERPVVLTANHHGVDFFAQSVQGTIIFSLASRLPDNPRKVVPVFACGNIPMDNITYPLGMLMYENASGCPDSLPHKLPVFSNSMRRKTVSMSCGMDAEMIQRAVAKVQKAVKKSGHSQRIAEIATALLLEEYGQPDVLNLPSYSDQAVLLNARLWERLFAQDVHPPSLAYLDLEAICTRLLLKDLFSDSSLISYVFFDRDLRERLLENLNGETACWNRTALKNRLEAAAAGNPTKGFCGGSIFFWALNKDGRKVPLMVEERKGKTLLTGVDDKGAIAEFAFTPKALSEALQQKRIIPSLFTSFTVLSLARNVTCAGGYFQAEYLPKMQKGLIAALQETPGYNALCPLIFAVETDAYLGGMQAVMTTCGKDRLVPAGPLEIMASGGLNSGDMNTIAEMTLKEAHLASLFDIVPELASHIVINTNWRYDVSEELYKELFGRVVIKT